MDAVEAFRAAYAAQLMTPESQDIDTRTGLPTGEISNTSPWIEHTGLWRYPSGKGPDDDLKQPFVPGQYYEDNEDGNEELSDKEIDALIDELVNGLDTEQTDEQPYKDDE